MEKKLNQQGYTLIEVVASLLIIGIVLISFFALFTNASLFNSKNNSNLQAINIAKQEAATFNSNYSGMKWDDMKTSFTEYTSKPGFYQNTYSKEGYIVEITINSKKENGDFYRELRKMHIKVWKDSKVGKPLSDTFTYHEGVIDN